MTNHPNRNIKNRLRDYLSEPLDAEGFREIRLRLGLTQSALGELLKIGQPMVSMIESGERDIEHQTKIVMQTLDFLGPPFKTQ